MSGGGPTPSNKYQLNIFLTMLVQGNTSTFICMGADLARRLAITSSFSFAALHIRAGITQKGLWRVWPCPCTMSLLPPSTTPYGSAFEVSAWSCTERRGLPGLPASPDPICSGGTFMWFTPAARLPGAIQPVLQAPPSSGSRALRRGQHGLDCWWVSRRIRRTGGLLQSFYWHHCS